MKQDLQIPGMGKRIREQRKLQGLSQEELSVMIGAGRTMVAHYEKESRLPSFGRLIRLAQVLNVSTDYLLGIK